MLKLLCLVIYNFFRIGYNKICYGKRFSVYMFQRISPKCALKVYGQGMMCIDRNTEFASGCDFQVHGKGQLSIGKSTYFNRYCMISAHQSVKIGSHCMFEPGVKIFDNNHLFSKNEGVSSLLNTDEIVIGDCCWIASDAIILKGAHIGDRCVIGAGCVISGEVPAETLVKQNQHLEYTSIYK